MGGVIALTTTVLVALVVVRLVGGPSDDELVVACQDRITGDQLVPPAARYDLRLWAVTPMPDDTWTVQGTVWAQVRSTGPLYQGSYACVGMRETSNGGWSMLDVDATFRP